MRYIEEGNTGGIVLVYIIFIMALVGAILIITDFDNQYSDDVKKISINNTDIGLNIHDDKFNMSGNMTSTLVGDVMPVILLLFILIGAIVIGLFIIKSVT